MISSFPFFAELDWLFGEIVQKSLFAAVLVATLFLVTLLGRNRISPRIRFAVWFLVPIQLLFFISVPSQYSVKNLWPQPVAHEVAASPEPSLPQIPVELQADPEEFPFFDPSETQAQRQTQRRAETQAEPIAVSPTKKTASMNVLGGFWLGGVALFLGGCVWQIRRLHRDILAGSVVVDTATLRIFEDCKRLIGVNTWIMLVESSRIQGPFLVGVFRPVIVIPQGLIARLSPGELRHLFLHELAHLRYGDLISGWLMSFVLALHWFNPFVWLAVRTMNHLREEAADAAVLELLEIDRKLDYGNTLLTLSRQLAKPRFVPGIAGILETRSFLRRRIDMIMSPTNWKKSWTLIALVFCAVVSLTL